jgi:hypothetical protein
MCATALGVLGAVANREYGTAQDSKETSGLDEACPRLRVTTTSDKTLDPLSLLPYRNSYQRTTCRANDVL